ncbi:hypothetical protein [Listeria costaricensis]|uniref:hypothetical protein n=1 Tax=Listeria costaricensis TaxID=2026604 RepID=UPI000C08339D|nr:hypothetical protein [Listeria costaricensis]
MKKLTGILLLITGCLGVVEEVIYYLSPQMIENFNIFNFSSELTILAGFLDSILLIFAGIVFLINRENHSFLLFLAIIATLFVAILGLFFANSYSSFHIRPAIGLLGFLVGLFYYTKY